MTRFFLKKIEKIEKAISSIITPISQDIIHKRESLKHFYDFCVEAWPHSTGNQFIPGLPAIALCDHLEACYHREIRNLIINIPIRCGKSHILCVMFPVWVWTQNLREKFLYSSYGEVYATRDHVASRRLIESSWFQSIWGDKIILCRDQNTKEKYENTAGGFRASYSLFGQILGGGADFLIIDDPNNPAEIDSPTERYATNTQYTRAFSTRFENPDTVVRIVSGQRLHREDLSGFLLGNDAKSNEKIWTNLILPMEFSKNKRCETKWKSRETGKILTWKDPRKKENELLWPERLNRKAVQDLKQLLVRKELIASMLQQEPVVGEGTVFDMSKISYWEMEKLPNFIFILSSWDTSLTTGDNSCFSAITTWGVYKDPQEGRNKAMSISPWRGKVEYHELKKIALNFASDYYYEPQEDDIEFFQGNQSRSPNITIIEEQVNGFSLIQDMRKSGINIRGFNPKKYGSKKVRAQIAATLIEQELVCFPAIPPDFQFVSMGNHDLIEEMTAYTGKESNDYVDSTSQGLIMLYQMGLIGNSEGENASLYRNRFQENTHRY